MAAPPLPSSSSAASDLFRGRPFQRPFSLSPARFSASCVSAGGSSHCHYYSYSHGGDGAGAAAAASGTLYDVLGLAAGATAQEIKQAYRNLARACHPDAAAGCGGGGRVGAAAGEFMRVHAAYATLSDPIKRAEYDRRMLVASAAARRPSSSSASHCSPPAAASSASRSSHGFPRRTWETDQCW